MISSASLQGVGRAVPPVDAGRLRGRADTVTAFMSAATKATALILMLRVLRRRSPRRAHLWTIVFAVIACTSLAIGNLAALVQRDVKRMPRLLVDLASGLHADSDRCETTSSVAARCSST
jgi:hypothetical protein